ncbi:MULTISPECIES: alpha-galactosidase [unclassified Clostridium]|uniref:alpha-galactosidase n=1 Tax=unclassified Clostridium TaxID=2614128 RepID=UPI0002984B9B|nr:MULTISPECIES: alpha-galactosidase [unclassified Clostridium]EKQ56494.1 MAG: alpha-galactosidase [Clostridium sp. Maddingley MBC34-26]
MGIKFNESTREFHLYNNNMSYIIRVIDGIEQIENVYYGKRLRHRESFKHIMERELRPSCNMFEGNHTSSLEHIKQDYPSYGTTDYRYPAHTIVSRNGSRISNYRYVEYKIYDGKNKLKGLPATYVEEASEAQTLEITLFDEVLNSKLILTYTIYEEFDAICRNTKITNEGSEAFFIDNAMSSSVDLVDSDFEMIHTSGAWARECHLKKRELTEGIQSIHSLRGASSHVHNPFMILKRPDATEHTGEVYGLSLVYSGNFLGQVEVDPYGVARVMMGINPYEFKWKLDSEEEFQTPECVMVYTDNGLNAMSQTYHKLYRTRLARGKWRDKERPILVNNWEATYFDFDEEKILSIVRAAKDLGIELFVLDDGWFGRRNDDTSSLGDWFENKEKLPNGIAGLSEKVEEIGLKFGLWFEPEMVCKDTKLFKEHPEWAIQTPSRNMSHGRNQFILDFTRDEVVEHVFGLMDNIIGNSKISYIKWDMNRYITEPYSLSLDEERQGEVFHRYILGVYKLAEKIISKYPDLLIESCAGGGARFDPGMLYYAPQTWASDDTDAIERLKIQYGTSMIYPLSAIGSHVSAVPNHQVGRLTPLSTRANVAYFGTFGYEFNVNTMSDEEKEIVKEQVKFFKKNKSLVQKGNFYRMLNPFESNETSWMVVSEDKSQAIVGYYQALCRPNEKYNRVKLQGLNPNKLYEIEGREGNYYGVELMNLGIILSKDYTEITSEYWSRKREDFMSQLFILNEVK